jgi:hypothetical protein
MTEEKLTWQQKAVRRHRKTPDMLSDTRIIHRLKTLLETSVTRPLTDDELTDVEELFGEFQGRGLDRDLDPAHLTAAEKLPNDELFADIRNAVVAAASGELSHPLANSICAANTIVMCNRLLAERWTV